MLNTQGLVHFTIPVKDLDRLEEFYTPLLGFKKLRRNEHTLFLRSGKGDCTKSESEPQLDAISHR